MEHPAPDSLQEPPLPASPPATSSPSSPPPLPPPLSPPTRTPSPPPPSRHRVLQAERVLAAIEARLRASAASSSALLHDVSLEALGDAYRARLAGHALDNLDRAIISYRLADRRLPSPLPLPRARILAKLGRAWYDRLLLALQMRSVPDDAPDVRTHAHLQAALNALNQALTLFDHHHDPDPDHAHAQHQTNHDPAYLDALLCRGLVCDRLYQTLDIDWPGKPEKDAARRKTTARSSYITECIASLERVLDIERDSEAKQLASTQLPSDPAGQLSPVERAQAVMCLARAYSNVEGGKEYISKAVMLLAKVSSILRDVDDKDGKGTDLVDKMKKDAEAQIVALAGSTKFVESRCVVC